MENFLGIGWQELPAPKPDTLTGKKFVEEQRLKFSLSFN